MSLAASLATRYAGRPLLLAPLAAEDLARRIRAVDARAFERPSRLSAIMRRLGGGAPKPQAWDDDDDYVPPPPLHERLAYQPRWAGTPEALGFCWSLKSGVALMCCDTPLVERGTEFCGEVYHGYDTLLMGMREAAADERVKGIFLRLDSPGGVVGGGLAELSSFMRSARASAGGKPIWVYADMACSAAYWIAAQADRIVAPSVGYVGSIGAVIVHEDWSAALETEGVVVTAIQFGAQKTDGAWWAKLSDRARENFQADIDQCGRLFIGEVTAGRPQLTADALQATEAAVFMGDHDDAARSGLALGFVDAIGGEEATFLELVAAVADAPAQSIPGNLAPAAAAAAPTPTLTEDPEMSQLKAKSPALIAAEQQLARANAAVEKAKAEGGEPGSPEGGGDGGEGGAAEDEAPPAGGGAGAGEGGADEGDETAKIADSEEAKANPAAALAAIKAGLSYDQFKAMAGATPAKPASRLDRAMSGSRRLGPDGAAAQSGKSNTFGSALTKRAAERRQGAAS